ncbi:MAG: DUF1587 domain-containing protein, partial [Verrucomicrobiales bacterium]|nr:DUF1587 domain-containing protein [Verrucomicrobiales bacterium]
IRPLLKEYCLNCHSTEKHKGDLDLERFSSMDEVKKHPKVWQALLDQLANNEMPPKEKPQPSAAQREGLSSWANAVLDDIALARAGDPGPVVLRRLSNAEYTYTIRDLTGVESLDPAREFPVDGAAGEGFMNTGNALVMSPSLITKYLDAGKEIASHAVLLPDGIRFSPKTSRRDWTEEILAEIREFYREFTDPRGGDKVNLQGIVFETNEGGRLPLEKYLTATLELRNAERAEESQRVQPSNAPVPLTPALSPGERVDRTPSAGPAKRVENSENGTWRDPGKPASRLEQPKRPDLATTRRTVPPLPEGEGRGEGEAPTKTPAALIPSVAAKHGLSPKYHTALWNLLNADKPSLLLNSIRTRWRNAKPSDAGALASEIGQWQKALWKFSSVGHIGKAGGPKAWMEPVNPLSSKQEVRIKIPASHDGKEVTLYLVAGDAGDGNEHDFVVWQKPHFVAPGRPSLLLRDVRDVTAELTQRRVRIFATAAKSLAAAAEASALQGQSDLAELAQKHGIEADALGAWLDYLGIGSGAPLKIEGYFTNTIQSASGYDFIKGWGSSNTPQLVANSSDQHVRIPGNMKPHGVAVHPAPKLQVAVGWRSPVAATLRIETKVQHAHPECGNGVTWSLELRRGATRQRLANGTAQGVREAKVSPVENLAVQPGDLVSLLIGPRDGNHSCDLTAIDLILTSIGENRREWNLAQDVSPDVLAGNPHADRFGHEGVWHFYTEPDKGGSEIGPVIPAGSLLAKWHSASGAEEKQRLAEDVQRLLTSDPPPGDDTPDAKLYQQLASLGGPLFSGIIRDSGRSETRAATSISNAPFPLTPALSRGEREKRTPSLDESGIASDAKSADKTERSALVPHRRTVLPLPEGEGRGEGEGRQQTSGAQSLANNASHWALDPALFGHHPNGHSIDAASLGVRAPSVVEIRLPADLVAGCEFVTTGVLDERTGVEGSVQLQALTTMPEQQLGLLPTTVVVTNANGTWTSDNQRISHATPVVANEGSAARKRVEAAFDEFRQFFPAALCYTKIVPVDEVVTLTLFYREDDQLARLMLDDAQKAKLDRLWDELHYASHDALTLVDAFEQIWQYATQDADPKVFEPLRKPIQDRASAFRQRLSDTQPKHLESVLEFADRAYRRPLADNEKAELRGLYRKLREQELPHDQAIRLTLARVLVAPAFLYRAEKPGPGVEPNPVNDWELANRL